MKTLHRGLSLALILILLLGVAAQAAGAAPDPNPSRETLDLWTLYDRYDKNTHVKDAADFDWPAAGTVWIEAYQKYSFFDSSLLNGITIPANLIVDVYDRVDSSNDFRFLVRYDTTGGSPITITDIHADIKRSNQVAGFDDVAITDYFAGAVEWAVEAGVTQGTGSGTFSPDKTVTRAEAVTFLWRAAGSPAPKTAASPFSDVTDQSAYYYKAVLWAVEQGITNGAGGGRFDLTGTLSYDQIFTFLCRFAGEEAGGDDWSAAAVAWARESGLTGELSFTAKAACPRADVVYCLYRQLGDQEEEQQQPVTADVQGARQAIIDGLLREQNQIDIQQFGLEATQAEALMAEITHVDEEDFALNAALLTAGGDNYYNVVRYNCPQLAGQTAWTLTVSYIPVAEDAYAETHAQEVTAAVERVLEQTVREGMSDYDIAKALHDYLALHCEYDMRLYSGDITGVSYSAYGALIEGTAVCEGYASAYRLLLEAAGLPCKTIVGFADGYHSWNQVQIGGEWYHVDVTWDDPTPDREGYVRYDYFLKSDGYMRQHQHTKWYSGYPCTSTRYDSAALSDTEEQEQQEQERLEQQQEQERLEQERLEQQQEQERLEQERLEQEAAQAEKEAQQALDEAAALEVVPLLEQAVAGMDCFTTTVTLTGYSDKIIKNACAILSTDGYTFAGYTYHTSWQDSDYRLSAQSGGKVSITNYKWADQETGRYAALIEAAIDSGKSRAELPPGNYENQATMTYASDACDLVGAEGYRTPGGMTAGEDYALEWMGTNASSGISTVYITYTSQAAMTAEEAMDYYLQQLRAAVQQGDTQVTLATRFGESDYRDILQEACATVRAETGYSIYTASTSVGTGEHTLAITPPSGK